MSRDHGLLPLLAAALLTVVAPVGTGATSYGHGVRSVEQEIDLRSLPSLLVEWSWEGTVDEFRAEDDMGYVVGGDRLSAIDLRTGEVLWEYDLNLDCSCSKLELLPTRIVAGIEGRALLIDRESGALAADVSLGESITALLPDPLVVAYRGELGLEGIVRLDESSGVELARYSPAGSVSKVERVGELLVVVTRAENGTSGTVAGLDLSLIEIWRQELPSNSYTSVKDGEVVVHSIVGRQESRQTLDPQTGLLLPRPSRSARWRSDLEVGVNSLAGGLALVLESGKPPVLIKPRAGSSRDPRWEVELPVVVTTSAEWGSRVVLANEPWSARGVVLIVDPRDGEILTLAAGLRGMKKLNVLGDLLISETASGLAAVRLDDFGPPEAAAMTVGQTVARILAEVADPDGPISPYAVHKELQSLGSAAFPYLTEAIPELRPEVLDVVARIVSEGGHGPAAAPLATRIETFLDEPANEDGEEGWAHHPSLASLGSALAKIATADEAATVSRLLDSGPLGSYVRLPLMAALGRVTPARALSALASLRAEQELPETWWHPPAADPWVELAAVEVDLEGLQELWASGRSEEAYRVVQAATTAMAESDGDRWVVFEDDLFQSTAHWAAPIQADGTVGVSAFVGQLPPPVADEEELYSVPVLGAALADDVLEVGYAGSDRMVVSLAELRLDSDGDGLTDRLERFLSLDPANADSDGDGLIDPVDPAPRGADRPATEYEAALLALHETLGLVTVHEEGEEAVGVYAFLKEAPTLEWRAGPAATFLIESEPDQFCRARSYRVAETLPRPLDDEELAIEVVVACAAYSEPDFTEGYVMKSTEAGWVLSGVAW